MEHFIISFSAIVASKQFLDQGTKWGQIGVTCDPRTYNPNLVKDSIKKYYLSLDGVTSVSVVIINKRKVSSEEYEAQLPNNIPIIVE